MSWRDIKVWQISAEKLIIRYGAGERNFAGVELIQDQPVIDLARLDLRGINLRGADLTGADLTGADLTGADLTGAILACTILERAMIRDANMHSANLCFANLSEADLLGTKMTAINANRAIFQRANIRGFDRAILAHADFRDAQTSTYVICRQGNLIWNTIMPDGSVVYGPQYGDGR